MVECVLTAIPVNLALFVVVVRVQGYCLGDLGSRQGVTTLSIHYILSE